MSPHHYEDDELVHTWKAGPWADMENSVGKNPGKTISATSPDDEGEVKTEWLPSHLVGVDLTPTERNVIEAHYHLPTESSAQDIADRARCSVTSARNILRKYSIGEWEPKGYADLSEGQQEAIDAAIANPDTHYRDLARELGYSDAYVKTLLTNYPQAFEERRQQLESEDGDETDGGEVEGSGDVFDELGIDPDTLSEGERAVIEAWGELPGDPNSREVADRSDYSISHTRRVLKMYGVGDREPASYDDLNANQQAAIDAALTQSEKSDQALSVELGHAGSYISQLRDDHAPAIEERREQLEVGDEPAIDDEVGVQDVHTSTEMDAIVADAEADLEPEPAESREVRHTHVHEVRHTHVHEIKREHDPIRETLPIAAALVLAGEVVETLWRARR